ELVSLAGWRSVSSSAGTPGSRTALEEAGVGRAAPVAADVREIIRDVVVVDALRVFRGNSESAVAFVKIAAAFRVCVIYCEFAVVFAAGAADTLALLELIAGAHLLDR